MNGHNKPEKVLIGQQNNVVREEMRPFIDEKMGSAAPLNTAIAEEMQHEEGPSLTKH